jgi:hypothetical protein
MVVVDVGAEARPRGREQDEVVADTLEVVHKARRENHCDVTVDGHIGEGGEELAPREGIEGGERLVEQEDARPLGERPGGRRRAVLQTTSSIGYPRYETP